VFTQAAAGGAAPARLFSSELGQVPMVLLDGGRVIVRQEFDLMLFDPGSDRLVPLVATPAQEVTAALSPNGRWLAYGSDESGRQEIYVRPFPDVNAGRWLVSTAGGVQPVWSRDGTELFYFQGGELVAVRVAGGPTWSAGAPTVVVKSGYRSGNVAAAATYDVSRDGARFLMSRRAAGGPEPERTIQVVLNWFEDLTRLAPR
jgi:serine/threonine-protein kinase